MFELGFYCAVVAFVYAGILVKPGHILHWWAVFLEKHLVKEIFQPAYERKESWIYKPLVGCPLCVGGQIGLWTAVFMGGAWYECIILPCLTILFVSWLMGIHNKLN
ncbi:MAG: hypothetical protein ACTHLE_04130 [Agriterribacter sp.]